MSIKAVAWALEQPIGGNEKVVLISLANRARDEDGLCWPGQKEIARQACVSEKTVGRLLAKLEEKGYLSRTERRRQDGGRTSDLIRLLMGTGQNVRGATGHGSEGGAPDRAVSVQEPPEGTELPLERAGAAVKPVSYRGKAVPPPIVDEATRLLGVFNEVTERDVGARTGSGEASPPLKQIIGAMLARPAVTPDRWEAAIRNVAANPPGWAQDSGVQIGTIFGERAAEVALTNAGKKAAEMERRTAKDPEKAKRVEGFMAALGRMTS